MRTAQQRIDQYNARMEAGALKSSVAAVESLMEANFGAYANDWVPKSSATKDVLDTLGIGAALYFLYHGFSSEVYRATRTMAGESLKREAWAIMFKFVGMGCAQSVCESILSAVYTITAPAGGPFALCGQAASAGSPADGATGVALSGAITWNAHPAMTGVDMYLDIVNPPLVQQINNVRTWHFDYGPLAAATPHFWRVDVHYNDGAPCTVTGTVYTFTTA